MSDTPAQGTTPLYSVSGLNSVFGKSGKKRFAAGILVTGYECERQRLIAEADKLRAELIKYVAAHIRDFEWEHPGIESADRVRYRQLTGKEYEEDSDE